MSDERGLMTLQDTMTLGNILAKSGYFSDAKGEAQAVVKVLAGREMGFGPIASMTGVYIVQGKPSIGANLLGAAIKGSGRYDYRVIELTNERAVLAFFQGGEEIGRSEFTMADAKVAGLTGNATWTKFPRNMLFSRAMSNGARWYCPDVFSGVTPYTPEEMGADVDQDGDVIDVTPTPVPEPAPAKPAPKPGAEATPADSLDDTPTISSPPELIAAVKPLEYYNHGKHMLATYNKVKGTDIKNWPLNDPQFFADALETLTNYAAEQAAQDAQAIIKQTAEQMKAPL